MASNSLQYFFGVVAALILLAVTYRLRHRISIGDDFALARRRLPDWLTGLSQAINCVPVWLLLALILHAYTIGLAAIWMALACALGQLTNWWLIAPRVRAISSAQGRYSLSQLLAANAGERLQSLTLRSAVLIVVCTLGLASVTFLQWAAQQWIAITGGSFVITIIIISAILLAITAFGGLWSASSSDAAQATIILIVLAVVATMAMIQVGGSQALWSGLRTREHVLATWFGGYSGVLAMAFSVGTLFVAFSGSAQPQVFSRYLACKDEASFKKARLIAIAWTCYVLIGALTIGWCARLLLDGTENSRTLLQGMMSLILTAPMVTVFSALVLISFSVASLSPWIGIATHIATDLRGSSPSESTGAGPVLSLVACRLGLFTCALCVMFGAIYLPMTNSEDRLWFCWQSLGAAFGPLLFVRLSGKKVRAGSSLGSIWSGFILSALLHLMPDTPGDLLERSLPFVAAMGIALSGGERRRNPDRADRGDKTVHDHLPI